ncbi:MAG TPA: DUF4136 domain-containing protein [Polyangiaceae bacterium]|nr:DUF4136 domain-containing protein [Polyangiaceae bacterium]
MAACTWKSSPAVLVETESSAAASFAAYRTFGFGIAEAPPAPFQVSARSFEEERRMRGLIAVELVRKGYAEQRGPAPPDLLVRFASGDVEDPPYGDEPPMFELPVKGVIVIDVFDASIGAQVWHSSGEVEVDARRIDDQVLQQSVQRVLASFPGRGTNGLSGVTSAQHRRG